MRVGILCLCASLTCSHCQHGSLFVTLTNNAFLMLEILHTIIVSLSVSVCFMCECLYDLDNMDEKF